MCKCGCESKGCYENYFVIYKGDDTDFIEGQSLVVEISTDIDLDGSTATFSFLGFSQTFDPIPSDKKLNIIIPHSETAKFPVGMVEATVTITNSSSKIRTVSNTIPIIVTQSVDEAYSPDNPNAISVTLSNGETGRLNAALDDIELLKKNKADKTDLEGFATEADLLAFYYPDGNVTSMGQITTSGIEYAVGSDGGAYVVKGDGLTGHVVLPWKVTISGNEYKVTAVGESAFSDNSFTGLTAPTTVKTIGNSAFIYCFSLTSVNLPSATSIGNYAFESCGVLTTINLPSAASIGNYAFSYCHSLTSINLPSAKSIGGNTFYECDFIKSVSLPSATTINNSAFDSCLSLESVSIPSATSIGTYAFNGCSSLTTIDFGPSPRSAVPSLSDFAFEGVPTSCKFIIPLGMYDEWIAASGWSDMYSAGYKFEGYASTAQLADKADKATTLAGYGITDGATKTELNAKADKSALAAKADKATTLAGYGITDAATMASITPEYSTSSSYSVGAFVYHDGSIYQCKTAVPEGGEAWNAAHWELRKLDDFFTNSNSLLTATIDALLPYPLYAVPSTGLIKDRAINTTSLASVTVPDNFTDLLIRATVASSLSVTMPDAIATKYGDTFPGEAGEYLITITKTGAAEAYVRTIKLEVANA